MMRLPFSKYLAIASMLSGFFSGPVRASGVKCALEQAVPKEPPHFASFPDEHEHSSSGIPEKAQMFLDAEKSGAEIAFREEGHEGELSGKVSGVHVLDRVVKNGNQDLIVHDLVFQLNGKPFHSYRYYHFYETRLGSLPYGAASHAIPLEVPHPLVAGSISSSFLFYEGALPKEAVEAIAKRHDPKLSYARNEHTGVVAIYSPQGVSHADLKKCVPKNAKILGGTRFRFNRGKMERRNSLYFEYLDGMRIQDYHFKVSFRMQL